jgi:hypothetical protein
MQRTRKMPSRSIEEMPSYWQFTRSLMRGRTYKPRIALYSIDAENCYAHRLDVDLE